MTGGVLSRVRVGYSTTSPTSWNPITQVLTVEAPRLESDEVDVTVHGDSIKRTMPGLFGATPMRIRTLADLDPATSPWVDDIRQMANDRTVAWWRIEIAVDRTGSEWRGLEFQGYVASHGPVTGEPTGRSEYEIVVRFAGESIGWTGPAASQIS